VLLKHPTGASGAGQKVRERAVDPVENRGAQEQSPRASLVMLVNKRKQDLGLDPRAVAAGSYGQQKRGDQAGVLSRVLGFRGSGSLKGPPRSDYGDV
jgi:hypothetical protein